MIIESITLFNFRQYLNKQTIHFAFSSTKNVTVIHGENGSGKTALLNAFIWCLYGDLDLPNSKNIINEHAISEANIGEKIEAYVQLKFINNGKRYNLKRSIVAEKKSEEDILYHEPIVSLGFISEDGQSERIENYTEEINLILPKNLRSYFFFDGERIDNLSRDTGKEDIKKAIKSIMGLTILERAIEHTDSARKRFRSELKTYGDSKTKQLLNEIEQLENEIQDIEVKKKIYEENVKSIDRQLKELDEKLVQIEDAKKLQEQRHTKEQHLHNLEEKLKEKLKELNFSMSKYGHYAFTSQLLIESENVIKNNKQEKIIGITEAFINRLLKNGKCICGETIKEGSEHYKHIIDLKEKLNTNDLNLLIDDFKEKITRVDERRKKIFSELRNLKKLEMELRNDIRLTKEEIEEISLKLSEKESEEIVNLERKRNQLLHEKSEIDRNIGKLEEKIENKSIKLKQKKNEQEKFQKIESKFQLAQKRMKTCEELIEVMKKILEIREKSVKCDLQKRISKIYEQFLRKNYKIVLTDEYALKVINDKGNYVAMSQGERQITSLSFIGAIVDIAREIHNRENKTEFVDGGIYPIVMDSPFGALDSDHRERVSKGITKLADQIIVIVSTSQWRGEVEKELSPHIGKEYKLEYNDPRYNKAEPYEYTVVKEEV